MKYKRLGYRHYLKEQEELYDEVMEEIGHQIDVRLPSFNEKKVKKNKKNAKINLKNDYNKINKGGKNAFWKKERRKNKNYL